MIPRRLAIPILTLAALATPAARAHPILILEGNITRTDDTLHLTLDPPEHDLRHLDIDRVDLPLRLADAITTLDDAGTPLHWQPAESVEPGPDVRISLTPPPDATILTLFLDRERPLTPIRHQLQLRVTTDAPGAPFTRTLRLTSGANAEHLDLLNHLADPSASQPRFTDDPFNRILVIMDATRSPPTIEAHIPARLLWQSIPINSAPRTSILSHELDTIEEFARSLALSQLTIVADRHPILPADAAVTFLHPRASRAEQADTPHPRPMSLHTARVAVTFEFDIPPDTLSLTLSHTQPSIDAVALLPHQPPHRAILTNVDSEMTILLRNGTPTECLVGAAPLSSEP